MLVFAVVVVVVVVFRCRGVCVCRGGTQRGWFGVVKAESQFVWLRNFPELVWYKKKCVNPFGF